MLAGAQQRQFSPPPRPAYLPIRRVGQSGMLGTAGTMLCSPYQPDLQHRPPPVGQRCQRWGVQQTPTAITINCHSSRFYQTISEPQCCQLCCRPSRCNHLLPPYNTITAAVELAGRRLCHHAHGQAATILAFTKHRHCLPRRSFPQH
jgi:hypothetical protein